MRISHTTSIPTIDRGTNHVHVTVYEHGDVEGEWMAYALQYAEDNWPTNTVIYAEDIDDAVHRGTKLMGRPVSAIPNKPINFKPVMRRRFPVVGGMMEIVWGELIENWYGGGAQYTKILLQAPDDDASGTVESGLEIALPSVIAYEVAGTIYDKSTLSE